MTIVIIIDDECRSSYKESSAFWVQERAMRVSRERAAENRDRIIDAAGRLVRERGFDGIGVANLMKAAGLTHGGFYGNFESKEDLAVEACERVLARTAETWPAMAAKDPDAPLKGLLEQYLT